MEIFITLFNVILIIIVLSYTNHYYINKIGKNRKSNCMCITLPYSARNIVKKFMIDNQMVLYTVNDDGKYEEEFHGGRYNTIDLLIYEKKPFYVNFLDRHIIFWYYGIGVSFNENVITINVYTNKTIPDNYETIKNVSLNDYEKENLKINKILKSI